MILELPLCLVLSLMTNNEIYKPQGIFLSNGPGDPLATSNTGKNY